MKQQKEKAKPKSKKGQPGAEERKAEAKEESQRGGKPKQKEAISTYHYRYPLRYSPLFFEILKFLKSGIRFDNEIEVFVVDLSVKEILLISSSIIFLFTTGIIAKNTIPI